MAARAANQTLEGAIGACERNSTTSAFEGEIRSIGKTLAPKTQIDVYDLASKVANDRLPEGVIDLLKSQGHKDYVMASTPKGSSYDSAQVLAQLFNQHYILQFKEDYPIDGYRGGVAYRTGRAANDNVLDQNYLAKPYKFHP